jgi:thioredoxin 2
MADEDKLIVVCPTCGTSNRVPAARAGEAARCGKCGQALFLKKPVVLDGGNFDRHAASSDIPLLADFWAPWCGPCLQMAPAFAAAAARLEPRFRLGKVDTEAQPALAARFAIRSIPTLAVIAKGREVARTSGSMPEAALVQWALAALPAASRAAS